MTDKLIIAHRGASGYLPEHTLESKALAHAMGAPYLEQDLALSRDDQLIVIHDHYLDRVTDVAEVFPGRQRADGRYYVIDFTLDELRRLRFSEGFKLVDGRRVPVFEGRFPLFRSRFALHTFEEEIEFIQGLNATTGREAGLYVETKAPWFHKQEGKDISRATLKVLKRYGYTSKESKVFFQTFDYPDLQYVKGTLFPELNMELKTILLITDDPRETQVLKDGLWVPMDTDYLLNPENFEEIARYADGVGPDYHLLIDGAHSLQGTIVPNALTSQYRAAGLAVHPWTVRADALPDYAATVEELFAALLDKAGCDGLFTDFPDRALSFLQRRRQGA